jgi:hypothetical protein
MLNFAYHSARLKGNVVRQCYRTFLPLIVRRRIRVPRSVPFHVFSYSSEADIPEQIASIRSFLRYIGRPKKFTVVSDGSHSARSVRLLEQTDPSVQVQLDLPAAPDSIPERFRQYLRNHPTGKQLALIMSLPENGPALYIDSDVLFFQSAADVIRRAAEKTVPAYYLEDCQFSGDARLMPSPQDQQEPVNTGVLLIFEKLDWSQTPEQFLALNGEPGFHTNQTLTHLTMHANGAQPFDPAKYVLQLDDQCTYRDLYASPTLALRHYVNPVRHKFWNSLLH